MKITTAILQVADTGPLESIVEMLESVGIRCLLPDAPLKDALRRLGCDTVLDVENLVKNWGYDEPHPIGIATLSDMERDDVLYVDVKAHRNGPLVWKRWPNLEKRTLWYRINGGKPEHVVKRATNGVIEIDHGDEVNPPCPILTPNQWYDGLPTSDVGREDFIGRDGTRAYACWPPFTRVVDYLQPRNVTTQFMRFESPICLIHGVNGWGYKDLIPSVRELGVKFHGVSAPDGLINHREIPTILSRCLAMVHLKSNDAPGYAIYEALAAGCPVICTRRLIWRCRMQDLLIPGETCLVFDRETHDGLTPEDVATCSKEIAEHLKTLSNVETNLRIGDTGRSKLLGLMWSKSNSRDVASLRGFLARNYS